MSKPEYSERDYELMAMDPVVLGRKYDQLLALLNEVEGALIVAAESAGKDWLEMQLMLIKEIEKIKKWQANE